MKSVMETVVAVTMKLAPLHLGWEMRLSLKMMAHIRVKARMIEGVPKVLVSNRISVTTKHKIFSMTGLLVYQPYREKL